MNAFISWSGSRELAIARALAAWLGSVAPEVQPFVSSDLPKGRVWFDVLASELEGAQLGFVCLAPPRVASAWQLIEAGALWRAVRRGGLFPVRFGLDEAELPDALRAIQSTGFDKDEFRELAKAVRSMTRPGAPWDAERERAFGLAWDELSQRVGNALRQPDDGVRTRSGFIHEVAGGWWQRVVAQSGQTKLTWLSFEPSNDGAPLTIHGRGYDHDGKPVSRFDTDLIAIRAEATRPTLEYYWEGRHPHEPTRLFGGKGWMRFTLSPDGRIEAGDGEFVDACQNQALPPTTKLVDLRRASAYDVAHMAPDARESAWLEARVPALLDGWP